MEEAQRTKEWEDTFEPLDPFAEVAVVGESFDEDTGFFDEVL